MPNLAYLGLGISHADVSVCFLLADGRASPLLDCRQQPIGR